MQLTLCEAQHLQVVVLSGGVFQNRVLLSKVPERLAAALLPVWTIRSVPAGDGGLGLGQAAIASLHAQ